MMDQMNLDFIKRKDPDVEQVKQALVRLLTWDWVMQGQVCVTCIHRSSSLCTLCADTWLFSACHHVRHVSGIKEMGEQMHSMAGQHGPDMWTNTKCSAVITAVAPSPAVTQHVCLREKSYCSQG